MIVKEGNKHVVKSHDGSKVLGRFASRKEAEAHLARVEMFKAMSKAKAPPKGGKE
jgi:hypothetical protein